MECNRREAARQIGAVVIAGAAEMHAHAKPSAWHPRESPRKALLLLQAAEVGLLGKRASQSV